MLYFTTNNVIMMISCFMTMIRGRMRGMTKAFWIMWRTRMISMETLPYFGLRLTLGTSTISASELFIFWGDRINLICHLHFCNFANKSSFLRNIVNWRRLISLWSMPLLLLSLKYSISALQYWGCKWLVKCCPWCVSVREMFYVTEHYNPTILYFGY